MSLLPSFELGWVSFHFFSYIFYSDRECLARPARRILFLKLDIYLEINLYIIISEYIAKKTYIPYFEPALLASHMSVNGSPFRSNTTSIEGILIVVISVRDER